MTVKWTPSSLAGASPFHTYSLTPVPISLSGCHLLNKSGEPSHMHTMRWAIWHGVLCSRTHQHAGLGNWTTDLVMTGWPLDLQSHESFVCIHTQTRITRSLQCHLKVVTNDENIQTPNQTGKTSASEIRINRPKGWSKGVLRWVLGYKGGTKHFYQLCRSWGKN